MPCPPMDDAGVVPTKVMWTIQAALRDAKRRFEMVSESASLDAQILLCAALGVERAYLLAHPEHPLTDEQAAHFGDWVERRAAGEPIAYILGKRGFYDLDFIVTPGVLIPRPETELLLEQALTFVQTNPHAVAADIGTGSGALAVTLAAHCPQVKVYAVDISPAALDIARHNAALNGVAERVTFLQGDLLAPLREREIKLDLLLANLPYIASDELLTLDVSSHEPRLALDGGTDGLDLIRRLLTDAPMTCRPSALILLEIGATQGTAALALAQQLNPTSAAVLQDYARLDRILRVML